VKYPGLGRLGGYAEEVAAALRRRRDLRRPRVRVRIGHGEPRVLEEGSPAADRLLVLARELVADQGRPPVSG
jgi:nucleotide-binding universal stress UspA family protein